MFQAFNWLVRDRRTDELRKIDKATRILGSRNVNFCFIFISRSNFNVYRTNSNRKTRRKETLKFKNVRSFDSIVVLSRREEQWYAMEERLYGNYCKWKFASWWKNITPTESQTLNRN